MMMEIESCTDIHTIHSSHYDPMVICNEGSYYSDEFWMSIFVYLDSTSLINISQTCYGLSLLADDKPLWFKLLQKDRKKVICIPRNIKQHPKDIYLRRKDFDTVSAAIAGANPDSRDQIFVAPGLYQESLVIDRSVDIIGEGPLGSVVVEGSTSNTIISRATEGSVSNIHLRQTGHWFCIDIEKGSLRIDGCDISNTILSAIKVGKEGSPIISNNKIHDTHEAGVAIFGGSGVIEHNEFVHNRYGSIEIVYATANPIIRHNIIHHNRGYGIHVHTQSRPIIQANTIKDNESDGISCWGAADPYVTANKISRNKGDGIYIHEDGKGTFEHNEIFQQKLDGIRTSKSCPYLISNSIHNNEGDGVRIVMNANPTVRGNKIYENNRVGVHVYREGCGTCTDNHIYANRNAGIQIYGGGSTQILRNRIQHNRCTGVYVSDRANVSLQHNDISYNGDCGVEVVSGASASPLEGNSVHHNKSAGMAVYVDTKSINLERTNQIFSNGASHHADYNSMSLEPMAKLSPLSPPTLCHQSHHQHQAKGSVDDSSINVITREGRSTFSMKSILSRSDGQNPEIVSFLAERAILHKLCTYAYTREYYHAQYWYECRTCSGSRQASGSTEVSVCEQCAKACHVGHELSPRKFGHFYCDCGQMTDTTCKCMPSDHK
eukprot:TRINITY_DN1475_c0_g1_i1.p1 TRINITY_DN1475_c0_g1~~TRINITY_DN1475_c0_g1_i1.p1  ORF type:complete len:661 (-),score=111.42 TRINITY_DN1475_c0_g1_i1:81-2063(-)